MKVHFDFSHPTQRTTHYCK